ncbi:MAG: hypothetical protein RSB76_02250 [Clostridia bacterium]
MKEDELQRRVSLITDVIILLIIVFITILLIQKLDVNQYADLKQVSSLLDDSSKSSVNYENEMYVKKIKKEYGVDILYGKNAKEFANKLEAVELYDENIINNNLKIIYKALQKYPIDLFDKVKINEYPMYVMLFEKFDNNNLALASRTSLNVFRIYLSNNDKFERSFHHELYHILEYWMENKERNIYDDWFKFNPDYFKYEVDITKLDTKYVYNISAFSNFDMYFVTKYSKTSSKEDRAEIFAELMMLNKSQDYLKDGSNIRKKVDEIYSTINKYLTHGDFNFSNILK